MSVTDLFWFFFIFMAIQPMIRQRLLDAARTKMIRQFESERGSRVILLVHRQETMSFLGFPFFKFINVEDSEQVLRAIHMTDPQVPLDIVLHTPGGLVLASLQIARALARHPGKVTVFVPHYAMSGGTLIALAADEICMSEHAVLGPVDPQVGEFPAASLLRVVEQKPIENIDDETLVLADQAAKAVQQLRDNVKELLCGHLSDEQCSRVAEQLSAGHWTHDFAITPDHARAMGLPVTTDFPQTLFELMNLYRQPVRQRSTVEYLPTPRRYTPGKPEEK